MTCCVLDVYTVAILMIYVVNCLSVLAYVLVMSESADRPSSVSSISSISLLEVKAETHLVLQAFLHRTLSVPLKDRPGRVGGTYRDHNKYR